MNKEKTDIKIVEPKPKKPKGKKWLKIMAIAGGILLAVIITILVALFIFAKQVFNTDAARIYYYIQLLANNPEKSLSCDENRTNVLVLGVAGGDHQGFDLTDTMIFTSTNIDTADSVMMAVPRDIWVPFLQTKVNAVYHYGETKAQNQGFTDLKQVFNELFGQPIHYFVLIDFQAFHDLIDLIDGIDVMVDRSFDDYHYPIPGKENDECDGDTDYNCRYEHLHFDRGLNHMDGQTALQFVRSRNAEGEEGTDFARSLRQEKVIMALKEALLSPRIIFSPAKTKQVYEAVMANVVFFPEPSEQEQAGFIKLAYSFFRHSEGFRTLSLETGSDDNPGFLVNPPSQKYGQWVLEPAGENWDKIKEFISEKVKGGY